MIIKKSEVGLESSETDFFLFFRLAALVKIIWLELTLNMYENIQLVFASQNWHSDK